MEWGDATRLHTRTFPLLDLLGTPPPSCLLDDGVDEAKAGKQPPSCMHGELLLAGPHSRRLGPQKQQPSPPWAT